MNNVKLWDLGLKHTVLTIVNMINYTCGFSKMNEAFSAFICTNVHPKRFRVPHIRIHIRESLLNHHQWWGQYAYYSAFIKNRLDIRDKPAVRKCLNLFVA